MSPVRTECPLRVLHVIGGLNRAGAETALVNIARRIDQQKFSFSFVVHSDQPNAYDEVIRSLGMDIIVCSNYQRPWRYASEFLSVLRQRGPYDIVHSHVYVYSGLIMLLSACVGIPVRIVHSHTDTSRLQAQARLGRRLYLSAMKRLIRSCATNGIAVSQAAAMAVFGTDWRSDPRWRVMHSGIDLHPFHETWHRDKVKAEFGIPSSAWVVGQIGRFVPLKNQQFSLDILQHLLATQDTYLLLVGDGPMRPEVQARAEAMGLGDRVILVGLRTDIPRLLKGCIDVLLLPSLYEGLGLVGLEAQAAGVPVLASDAVPNEMRVVEGMVRTMPLQRPARDWAEAVIALRDGQRVAPERALALMEQSDFALDAAVRSLEALYTALGEAHSAHG